MEEQQLYEEIGRLYTQYKGALEGISQLREMITSRDNKIAELNTRIQELEGQVNVNDPKSETADNQSFVSGRDSL
tara:strand:- start:587 stop:811 length:225 start_codon:yes stop_codon:yes gene_type:complete